MGMMPTVKKMARRRGRAPDPDLSSVNHSGRQTECAGDGRHSYLVRIEACASLFGFFITIGSRRRRHESRLIKEALRRSCCVSSWGDIECSINH